ncbi:MAG: NfeD family protein [Thermoplasmatota archaeon]
MFEASDQFWTAVAFLMLGILLIVVEVFMPGNFIAVPGGALFFMGSIGLVAPDLMFHSAWSWLLWPLGAVLATGANLWAYKRWAPAGHAPLTMGGDSLPGSVGTVKKEIAPEAPGQVRIHGAMWSARSDRHEAHIPAGAKVRVVRVEGVYAVVEPVEA